MKKIFTLICALMGIASVANAATVDDIAQLKHSYVLIGDNYTNNGTEKIAKNALFGDNHFFTPTGHDKATNKGSVDLSVVDETGIVTEEIAKKYGEYGSHLNSLRLKTTQDVFAMSVTAKSKIIIFYENNNAARYPIFAKDASLKEKYTDASDIKATGQIGGKGIGRIEWTATDDGVVYVGAENQIFVSYVIVEANEAPGTPTVKVGAQTFEDGLWFREVTAKANAYKMEGSDEEIPTILTYTTDGSTPTETSAIYKEPIKCYNEQTVKFQAFQDFMGDGSMLIICDGADYDVPVSFSFDAPAIAADGANVTITSPYEGAKNFYTLNGGEVQEGSSFTLSESATVSAYSQIINGSYATFTTKKTTKDVYVLNPIKEKKTITVSGNAVVDEEATASSTTGTIYKIENGAITADKKDFFVKDLTFGALANDDEAKAKYQVPAGQEAYIQMSNTNIVFQVAEGDSVNVKVICSLNACKNIDAADAEDGSQVNDRKCYVNVSGTNYAHKDAEGNELADMKLYPGVANIIEFGLTGGKTYTFQKYSGTGAILISSIEITPVSASGISTIKANAASNGAIYNIAGQKVAKDFKGLVIKDGKKFIQK